MDVVFSFLVVAHFIGLAAIVGPFLLQMRKNGDFAIGAMLAGAGVQLITGIAMTGLAEPLDYDLDYGKIITKLVIAIVVFVAAFIGNRKAKKSNDRSVKPFFHAAGGLALVNIVLAVFW